MGMASHHELPRPATPLGRALLSHGLGSAHRIALAETAATQADADPAGFLRAELAIPSATFTRVEAEMAGAGPVDPLTMPPDPALIAALGPSECLGMGLLPWRRIAGYVVVLVETPDSYHAHLDRLTAAFGPTRLAIASRRCIDDAIAIAARPTLAANAETMVPYGESCRGWRNSTARHFGIAFVLIALLAVAFAPTLAMTVFFGWAIVTLGAGMVLKVAAAWVMRRDTTRIPALPPMPDKLPIVSIMVPLFHESEIANHLLRRLSAIDYPHALLDVILLLEEDDLVTRATLSATNLPRWIRAFTVPQGAIRTKPRALNYGLNFARGSIIGVYDAEDAPAPDQIRTIVAHFAAAAPDVACLQGMLDFYNDKTNWLSRCFTIEYATWFRLILPGFEKLGLVIPLGGTTLFFRRDILERLGGWDAHNVTEDADLGVRLARHGYQTRLVHTVTGEEANCHAWPWVKQRSRWLKGYAITYLVHMRRPLRLWRDLGARRFLGFQAQFLGTLSQFILAPLLWSFWIIPFGIPHPVITALPPAGYYAMTALFVATEVSSLIIGLAAARISGRKRLMWWVPTLHFYFPLASLASYKAIWEMLHSPFYWDKTSHGLYQPD